MIRSRFDTNLTLFFTLDLGRLSFCSPYLARVPRPIQSTSLGGEAFVARFFQCVSQLQSGTCLVLLPFQPQPAAFCQSMNGRSLRIINRGVCASESQSNSLTRTTALTILYLLEETIIQHGKHSWEDLRSRGNSYGKESGRGAEQRKWVCCSKYHISCDVNQTVANDVQHSSSLLSLPPSSLPLYIFYHV